MDGVLLKYFKHKFLSCWSLIRLWNRETLKTALFYQNRSRVQAEWIFSQVWNVWKKQDHGTWKIFKRLKVTTLKLFALNTIIRSITITNDFGNLKFDKY